MQFIFLVAAAAGAEGGAEGFGLGSGLVVLHADVRCTALAVYGVVLALGNIAAYAPKLVACDLLIVHVSTSEKDLPVASLVLA